MRKEAKVFQEKEQIIDKLKERLIIESEKEQVRCSKEYPVHLSIIDTLLIMFDSFSLSLPSFSIDDNL